jgi:predicted  nucleic acid-binding Zn-ribbon protein
VPDTVTLIALQDLDTSCDQLRYRMAHLHEDDVVEVVSRERDTIEAAIATARVSQEKVTARLAELDRLTDQGRAKRARLDAQLRSVVVVREAEALQREIARIDAERDEADDEGLSLLAELEALKETEEANTTSLAEVGARLAAALSDRDAAVAQLGTELEGLVHQRQQLVSALTPELVTRYEDLRKHLGGVAVARLVHGRCDGCHLDLSAVEIEEIKRLPDGELGECGQCGRLLVH